MIVRVNLNYRCVACYAGQTKAKTKPWLLLEVGFCPTVDYSNFRQERRHGVGRFMFFFSPPCLKLFLIKDRWQLQCLLCQILIAEAFHPRAVHARHNSICVVKRNGTTFPSHGVESNNMGE